MKKLFGLGKKKKSGPSPSPSESGSVLSLGYELKEKELSKLHRAASTGDSARIRALLPKHDINQLDKENRTPLHLACANGHPDAVKLLVENKAKLNICDNDSRTPLIKAIQCQHEQCANILLDHDADPNVVDVNGNSSLHLAALIPSMAVAVQLLEHGGNINAVNKDGCTPLMLAVCENHQDIVEFLIKQGASVNLKDNKGRTSLMIAAGNGQISLVKNLLQSNADIFIKDETGWTADDHAVMNGHHACSHLIIEHGSKNKHSASLYGAAKKGASSLTSPERVVEGGFTLGSPAVNKADLQVTSKQKPRKKDSKKGIDDYSQDDSESRVSGKTDSWASSDEDDLDFSPKKTSKPSLTQLLNTKKNVNEKGSFTTTQTQRFALHSKSDSEESSLHDSGDEDANILPPPKPIPQTHPFPQPAFSSPGSFAKHAQIASASLHSINKACANESEKTTDEQIENDLGDDIDDQGCLECSDNHEEDEESEDLDDDEEECEENDNEEEECAEQDEDCEVSSGESDDDNEDEEEEQQSEDDGSEKNHCDDDTTEGQEKELKNKHNGPRDALISEEHSLENENIDHVDSDKHNHGSKHESTDFHSKENMDVIHYDVYHNLSQVKQNADDMPDCSDVPVSLIYGLDENVTNSNGCQPTCIEASPDADQHDEVTNKINRHIRETSQSNNNVMCAVKDSQNPLVCEEMTLGSDLKMNDAVCLQRAPTGLSQNIDESFSSSESEEDNRDVKSPQHSFTADTAHQTNVHAAGDFVGRKVALMSELGFEDDDVESPWDSESASDSPRKQSASDIPAPAAPAHMQCISEESNEEVSEKIIAQEISKPQKIVLQKTNRAKSNELNSKSDLMADLGLDDADDIEDASDWDSTSHSLKYSVRTPREGYSKLNENALPQTVHDGALPKGTAALSSIKLSSVQEDVSEEPKKENVQSISRDITHESPYKKNGFLHGQQEIKAQDDFKEPDNMQKVAENKESSSDSEPPWEDKYENMWVDNEKKYVKSQFKDITAELKQKFGEIAKMKKSKSLNPDKIDKEESSHSLKENDKWQGADPKTTGLVMYPVSVDKDDKSFGNSESIDWSEDTKSKHQEHIVLSSEHGLKAAPPVNAQKQQKQANLTFGVLNIPVNTHFSKGAVGLSNPSFGKAANVLGQVEETVPFVNKKGTIQHSEGNSQNCNSPPLQNQLEAPMPQPVYYDKPNMHLDKQLEQEMRRFKNEVGMLQMEFLNLTRERSLLQKEVEREKTTVNRQSELEKSIRKGEKVSDLQEERNVTPKNKITTSSKEEKNGRRSNENAKSVSKSLFGKEGTRIATKRQKNIGDKEGYDDDTFSETSQKDVSYQNNLWKKDLSDDDDEDDMDDFSQSSVSVTEEYEAPTSSFRNVMLLIEQLNLEGQDSVNLLKIQTIIHEYEREIEKKNRRHALLAQEVKKLREERKEVQQMAEKNRELKSLLEYNKVEWDSDVSSLRSALKQEEEKRKNAEMLCDMSKEQLRRKDDQCHKETEEKQQLELALRNLELEMRSLRNNTKQIEEERSEAQRLYTQEHNSRLLQEETLNNLRRKIEEEENRKLISKSVEQVLNQPSEPSDKVKDLTHKNITLQEEITILKQELEKVQSHYQEEESRSRDENEALKEKIDDLRKDLKVNEETLTQTVIQCNGQLNALKTETNLLCSKLEHEKQSKERLEAELESLRSRLNSALQDVERSQASKTDTERTLQREREEWLRSKDKLNHDVSNLRESNNNLSQQLSRTEAKLNSLENDLHRTGLSLQEKSLLLESSQRDLTQAQGKVKDLERALQVEKEQINKSSIKQETIQERLSQITSENMQLRQQLEDAQNKGIIKEKAVSDVQDRFTDIYSKLRADAERQVQIVEERNKDLINKSNELREQVYKLETEKVERESTIRQLQQELADALKKLSMSEASLEVITRYRNDLEEHKQQLHKEIERFKTKVQDLEDQFLQSERHNHHMKNLLDDKERELLAAFQKVQELSNATAGSEKSVKQLEEHIQKLEIENAKIEATSKQQSLQIETLQKELQESVSIRNRLEDLVTGLQTSKIGLEEKVNQQVQKHTVLSQNAQDSHSLWEEELKSRSRLGVRLAELERSNAELLDEAENERKKIKRLLEHKKSMEERFDQEIKRNTDLQREVLGLKKLLKSTKKKLKEFEACDHTKEGSHRSHQVTDSEVTKLKDKIEELSSNLERESRKYSQLEASNRDLHEQLLSMKNLHKGHERLERSKRHLEDEVADLRRHIDSSKMDQSYMEQYKREIDERGRQELRQKLEEVNIFLQAQAASKDKLEQLRAENDGAVRLQLEHRIQDLEAELNKIKNIQEENMNQKDSTLSELNRIKDMFTEEQKSRKSLASKLERANERLADANAKLLNERQRSKSLIASSFLNGSLTGSPLLDTSPLGGLATSSALSRSLGYSGSFLNPIGNGLTTNEMGAYFVKMQQELEKNITKELDQANAELDTGCTRVSPVGSNAGSMRNLSNDQDLVTQARQQYLEVLKKNYKL
ncbi:ankyrin repeat domain-containing protein 26 [Gastrophryne carolinensis]